jgi:hypothetical protein
MRFEEATSAVIDALEEQSSAFAMATACCPA